jgi:ELWxxDGT repeat protein
VTDGSDAGTRLVHEHHPLSIGTSFSPPRSTNGNILYYEPDDPTTGGEVWRTDGTEAGTRVVNRGPDALRPVSGRRAAGATRRGRRRTCSWPRA